MGVLSAAAHRVRRQHLLLSLGRQRRDRRRAFPDSSRTTASEPITTGRRRARRPLRRRRWARSSIWCAGPSPSRHRDRARWSGGLHGGPAAADLDDMGGQRCRPVLAAGAPRSRYIGLTSSDRSGSISCPQRRVMLFIGSMFSTLGGLLRRSAIFRTPASSAVGSARHRRHAARSKCDFISALHTAFARTASDIRRHLSRIRE